MRADVARLDLRGRRRSLAGYSLGMVVYTFVVVALYPAFKDSTSLDDFVRNDSTAAALFGVTGSLTSADGWLNGNVYANFLPLLMLLLAIGYGAACLAGQDEDGTLCLLATLPLPRRTIVFEKAAALTFQTVVLSAAVGACVVAGRAFEVDIPFGNVVAVSATVVLLGLDFGFLAMAVGALTGSRGTAIGISTALAAASYLISSLAPVVSWVEPARYVSVFYWAVGNGQLGDGVRAADIAVLAAVALGALYAAVAAFDRLDLR